MSSLRQTGSAINWKFIFVSYLPISDDVKYRIFLHVEATLKTTVQQALEIGVIDEGNARFLLDHVSRRRVPLLRVNAKRHKSPVESRPISNLRSCVLGLAGTFLSKILLLLQLPYNTIAISSTCLIQEFEATTLRDSERFITYDITSWYPSLTILDDHKSVSLVVWEVIDRHFFGIGN